MRFRPEFYGLGAIDGTARSAPPLPSPERRDREQQDWGTKEVGLKPDLQPLRRAPGFFLQEIADDRPESIHVDQERVMALERGHAHELNLAPAG
jgi:hypothetical protein